MALVVKKTIPSLRDTLTNMEHIIYEGSVDVDTGDGNNNTIIKSDTEGYSRGGDGNDVSKSGDGDDFIYGGRGNDVLILNGLGVQHYDGEKVLIHSKN